MTEAERRKAYQLSMAYAYWAIPTLVVPVGGIGGLALAVLRHPENGEFNKAIPWSLFLAVGAALLAVQVVITLVWRRKYRQFLASTKWAKSQGYTARSIKLSSWQEKER